MAIARISRRVATHSFNVGCTCGARNGGIMGIIELPRTQNKNRKELQQVEHNKIKCANDEVFVVPYKSLAPISDGNSYLQYQHSISSTTSNFVPSANALGKSSRSTEEREERAWRECHLHRFSTVSEMSQEAQPEMDLLAFIKSTSNELEGPHHCWLNKVDGGEGVFKKDRTFLVVAGIFFEDSLKSGFDPVIMVENVKLLQQRYPLLYVMGFQSGKSVCSAGNKTHFIQSIMKEYITFPILLSTKTFLEMKNEPCFILFKDFKNPLVYLKGSEDLVSLNKAIEDLNMGNLNLLHNLKETGLKQSEALKEPYISLSMQNLLLYFPGCISSDECGNRLFLSDSNHHRILIFDSDGKILDCIGSSPGFEDGDFESAKLGRPIASFYHADDDCLYFADSENHAIRRADMGRRLLETLHPACNTNMKNNGLLSWIMDKLGMEREADTKSEGFDSESLMFPWHLIKSIDNSILIINRSFEILWIMDLTSGKIEQVVKGFPKVMEICGQMIEEKLSLLRKMPSDWLRQQVDSNSFINGIPYASLMSSVATFKDQIIICDTVGQKVLKFSESGVFSNFQFSNFGILGLPYWLASSLERVYAVRNVVHGAHADHIQRFRLLPGRIDIQINVDIPLDTELIEPLQEGCIWRQARGAATEISGSDDKATSLDKVGVAQLWYDHLDNLAFVTPETPESESTVEADVTTLNRNFEDHRVHIDCAVNTSPGTSEVIIYAALYLKLRRNQNPDPDNQEKYASRIENILNPWKSEGMARDPGIQLLLNSNRDLGNLIFIKPLHVRITLDTRNHPKSDNGKDFILTDTSVKVNVSLNS